MDGLLALGAANAFTEQYVADTAAQFGAVKGASCQIQSVTSITGGKRITFVWKNDEGETQTSTVDVMNGADGQNGADGTDGQDGADGLGIKSVDINGSNHLIITYDDDTTHDAGEIQGGGGGTTVIANPNLDGTEAELDGLQVGSTKYKVSTAKANPTLVGTETMLTSIEINGVKYKFPTLPLAESQEV